MKKNINIEIALTHILTRKRQTLIAALGVTFGIGMYIFSNSLMKGFGIYSRQEMFKVMAHIKIFKEDEISEPLLEYTDNQKMAIITNPKITTNGKSLIDPYSLLEKVRNESYVVKASPQVNIDVFYNNGKSQLKGNGAGVNILEADAMFNIQSTMVAGDLSGIKANLDAILIGSGVAAKMNVGIDDNITITSSQGGIKVMKVVGIFETGTKATDESKSYMHINAAQQLVKEGPTYVTDINANIPNPDDALAYSKTMQGLTTYKVEDWQTSNAATLSGDKIRGIMSTSVSMAIMLVAAFGIYNILNMTIKEKMNDIAILKATGFASKDIVHIFVFEAVIMGIIGTMMGLAVGLITIKILQNVYVGGPSGYFPIYIVPSVFGFAAFVGMAITVGAGYMPALKASKVDPVDIFRK